MKKRFILLGIISSALILTGGFVEGISNKKITINDYNRISFVDTEEIIQSKDFQKEMETQAKSIYGNDYFKIQENKILAAKLAEQVEKQIIKKEKYPNYYGGMYIDEKGILIVEIIKSLTANDKISFNSLKDILKDNDNTEIRYVKNSYNDLYDLNSIITSAFISGKKVDGFLANYVDESSNSVVIELEDNTIEAQIKFKNEIIDSHLIKFIKGEKALFSATTLKSGGPLPHNSVGTPYCSVGYRAKLNGKVGFVTAGHCIHGHESLMDGEVLGYKMNGSVDAGFIAYSKYSPSNALNHETYPATGNLKVSDSMPYIKQGTVISKVGITTNATIGSISATNWSGNLYFDKNTPIYFTNIIKAQQTCDGGDSGGVAFTFNPHGVGGGDVIGIISSCASSTTLGDSSYIVRLDQIKQALGVIRY